MIIKCYKDNILIGIKLDKDGDYLYVATMHEVQESKIVRRLHSGRIKEVITECESYCSHTTVPVRAALARPPDRLLLQLHTTPGMAPFLLSFRLLHLWHR